MLNLVNFENFGRALASPAISTLRLVEGHYLLDGEVEFDNVGELIAEMSTLRAGWVRWENGFPTKEVMGKINDAFIPPARSEFGDTDMAFWESNKNGHRDPWRKTLDIVLRAPDTDELFRLVIEDCGPYEDAPTGKESLGVLALVFAAQVRSAPNDLPLIELECDSFICGPVSNPTPHYAPRISVVGWVTEAEFGGK
jgi:hypothetical protein